MGDFKINEKTVFTQSGSAEPVMGSTVTGIPAAGVTGVLPVAVTGGSGLTHLASNPTVTLGSNATFPAGHILQVQYMSDSSAKTSSGSYANVLGSSYVTITKSANTNLFIHWSSQIGKNGNAYITGTKIQRATDSGFSANLTDLPASPQVATTTYPTGSTLYNNASGYLYIGTMGHTTMDTTITSTAGTFYFRSQFKASASRVDIDGNAVSIMYVMEVVA